LRGTPEQVNRRFDILRRERNGLILEGLGCAVLGEKRPERQAGHSIDAELANEPVLAKEIAEWL
jgi:hypothetical protein